MKLTDVFGRLPFNFLLKNNRVAGLFKSRYCLGILKLSIMHCEALLPTFCYIGMAPDNVRRPSIQACNFRVSGFAREL